MQCDKAWPGSQSCVALCITAPLQATHDLCRRLGQIWLLKNVIRLLQVSSHAQYQWHLKYRQTRVYKRDKGLYWSLPRARYSREREWRNAPAYTRLSLPATRNLLICITLIRYETLVYAIVTTQHEKNLQNSVRVSYVPLAKLSIIHIPITMSMKHLLGPPALGPRSPFSESHGTTATSSIRLLFAEGSYMYGFTTDLNITCGPKLLSSSSSQPNIGSNMYSAIFFPTRFGKNDVTKRAIWRSKYGKNLNNVFSGEGDKRRFFFVSRR